MAKNDRNRSSQRKVKSSSSSIWKRVGKWVLTFFYSAWVFFLGILVGRETAPVKFDIKDKRVEYHLKQLINNNKAVAETESDPLDYKTPELSFHDLKNPENHDRGRDIPAQYLATSETREVESVPKTDEDEKHLPLKTPLMQKKETVSEKSETDEPSRKQQDPGISRISETESEVMAQPYDPEKKLTIQVMSFRKLKDAERLVKRLEKKGYPAYVAMKEVADKGIFYRVRAGRFKRRADTRDMMTHLKRDHFKPYITNINR